MGRIPGPQGFLSENIWFRSKILNIKGGAHAAVVSMMYIDQYRSNMNLYGIYIGFI